MLDVAEHCFIRIAELMIKKNQSVRSIFTQFAIPEQFPDGTLLELLSPIAFLEGVKELGLEQLTEMEAACLLRVLTKPELEGAIILNELVLILENFGVSDEMIDDQDDDDLDDYMPSESEDQSKKEIQKELEQLTKEEEEQNKENGEGQKKSSEEKVQQKLDEMEKRRIKLDFDLLEAKGLKILQKLARFLLERYMHPREFFGPAIYKQLVKTKKRENNVDII